MPWLPGESESAAKDFVQDKFDTADIVRIASQADLDVFTTAITNSFSEIDVPENYDRWKSSFNYSINATCSDGRGFWYKVTSDGGSSGTIEPIWGTGTTSDGGLTWTRMGNTRMTIDLPEYVFDPAVLGTLPASPDTSVDISGVVAPTFSPIVVAALSLPTAPAFSDSAPSTDLVHTAATYTSAVLTAVRAGLLVDLAGGTGIDAAVEAAIYARATGRKDTENEQVYTEAENYFAARGYVLPPGVLAARLTQAVAEQTRASNNLTNDILIQSTTLEQENRKNALAYSLELEKLELDVAKFNINAAISVFTENVKKFNAIITAYDAESKALVSELETKMERNKDLAANYRAELEKYGVDINVIFQQAENAAKVYAATVDAYNGKARFLMAGEETKIREFAAKGELYTAQSEVILKEAEVYINKALNARAMQIEAAKAGANVSAQVVASALSSVSAGASYGFSGSGGISENYSYDQTKATPPGASTVNQHIWNEV